MKSSRRRWRKRPVLSASVVVRMLSLRSSIRLMAPSWASNPAMSSVFRPEPHTRIYFFVNIKGTASKPITIKNCGGSVNLNATGMTFAMKTQNSQYFRITGSGASPFHGIKMRGASLRLTLDYLSTRSSKWIILKYTMSDSRALWRRQILPVMTPRSVGTLR